MDQRKTGRLNLELAVHVWGVDRMSRPFAEIARAGSLSDGGAVLLGVRAKIKVGDLLDVRHESSRAQFRIMWINLSGEAGIQALEFEPPIWGFGLPKVLEMVGTG